MPKNGYIDSTKWVLLDFEKIKNLLIFLGPLMSLEMLNLSQNLAFFYKNAFFSKKKFQPKIATPPWKKFVYV